ncbi:TetR/AcrR family transcriptional regulator [Saccharomonospora sp. NPDC046836]|uniref:TetR/AcrR family transcriptional regulator n=1 Tax=Saccharomonospora sp. NPDC046836 TaxID=3156921 RepID=UPI0033ED7851
MPADPRKRLELLWGSSTPKRPGPRPKLTVDQIVATAIGIADAEGIEAVSMQRVATELGYTTMSLYRYVPSKEQLVEVMLDRAGEAPPPPGDDEQSWRSELENWVDGVWAMYLRHPWVLQVPITGAPSGPNQLAWFDAGLRPLVRAGLRDGDLMATILFLLGAVQQLAQLSVSMSTARTEAGVTMAETQAGYNAILQEFVSAERFPTLAKLTSAGVFAPTGLPDEGLDIDLKFGVQRVLDGIESYVQTGTS